MGRREETVELGVSRRGKRTRPARAQHAIVAADVIVVRLAGDDCDTAERSAARFTLAGAEVWPANLMRGMENRLTREQCATSWAHAEGFAFR